jgi:TonB family protein
MASPAEIAKVLPDTLPADFGEWDSEGSPATLPIDTRNFESVRGPVPVPKPPAHLAEPLDSATPLPTRLRPTPSRAPATSYPDDEAYLRRLRSITSAVDKLPPVPSQAETTAVAIPAKGESSSLEESLMRAAGKSFAQSPIFSSAAAAAAEEEEEDIDDEDEHTNKKWMMVVGVGVGSILLVVFQLFHTGMLSMVKQMVAPQPTATASLPIAGTDENLPSTPLTPDRLSTSSNKQQNPGSRQTTNEGETVPAEVQSTMMHDQLIAPTRIPQNVKMRPAADAPPSSGFGAAGMDALGGNGTVGNVFSGQSQPRVKAAPGKVTVSAGVAVGLLIHKTTPVYPPIAKSARVSGTVVLQGTISKTGVLENLRVVSGPDMLRQSALDAVRTWRYKPYILNGEPTEVETTITVNFNFGG